jgi:hypothetical protein
MWALLACTFIVCGAALVPGASLGDVFPIAGFLCGGVSFAAAVVRDRIVLTADAVLITNALRSYRIDRNLIVAFVPDGGGNGVWVYWADPTAAPPTASPHRHAAAETGTIRSVLASAGQGILAVRFFGRQLHVEAVAAELSLLVLGVTPPAPRS